MEIPFEKLSPETLEGIIEEFVTREGTDYGHHEHSFAAKVQAVGAQIRNRQVRILFDPRYETIHLVRAEEVQLHQQTSDDSGLRPGEQPQT